MSQRQKKIFLFDDVGINKSFFDEIFADCFEIIQLINDNGDLEKIKNEKENIAVIILSINFPSHMGFKVLQKMQEIKISDLIPIIVLTSEHDNDLLEKAFEMGAADVIFQPLLPSVVKKRISNLIRLRDHKSETAKWKYEANTDVLTNLLNRRALEKCIKENLGSSKLLKGALCLMDIDNFKQYNDRYGHSFGDEALISVANQLIKVIRKEDIVGRVGGDEFVIFLKNIKSPDEVMMRMQDVCNVIMKNCINMDISSSIGIAIYPDHDTDYSGLFKKADKALYQAKNGGKNRSLIYHRSFDDIPFQSSVSEVDQVCIKDIR